MRYDREPWRKLYRSEPFEQRTWPLMTRALRDYLVRLPEDDGVLLREPGDDPVGTLEQALNSDRTCSEQIRTSLEQLFADGYLVHDSEGVRIRNFVEAQEARSPDARRMAAKRARDKAGQSSSDPGTSAKRKPPQPTPAPPVTGNVTGSEQVTLEEKRREEKEKRVRSARAKPRDPMAYLAAHQNPEVVWAMEEWRIVIGRTGNLTPQRANALQARFEETSGPVEWREQVRKVLAAGLKDPFITDDCAGELLRMFDKRERFELYLRGGPKPRKAARSKTAVQPDVPGAKNYRPDMSKYDVPM